jgi:3-hydroxybutyryl-CoA dehydrogenase
MKIVVLGNDTVFETLRSCNNDANWVKADDITSLLSHTDSNAFFDVRDKEEERNYPGTAIPFFVHSVIQKIPLNSNVTRINAWEGFLQNSTWEIAGNFTDKEKVITDFLHKKIIRCANEPGFITARIIAMIINEAYFAKEENVSTEEEIDTAMKLGTNYPYGPFEWAKKIGVGHICQLLKKLSLQDARYQPAASLAKLSEN